MKIDARELLTYVIAILVLVGGWYSLVPYEFELDKITQGAIISFMGAAIAYVFGQSIAKQTANRTTAALMQTPPPPPEVPPRHLVLRPARRGGAAGDLGDQPREVRVLRGVAGPPDRRVDRRGDPEHLRHRQAPPVLAGRGGEVRGADRGVGRRGRRAAPGPGAHAVPVGEPARALQGQGAPAAAGGRGRRGGGPPRPSGGGQLMSWGRVAAALAVVRPREGEKMNNCITCGSPILEESFWRLEHVSFDVLPPTVDRTVYCHQRCQPSLEMVLTVTEGGR